jgi:hypothetical protein
VGRLDCTQRDSDCAVVTDGISEFSWDDRAGFAGDRKRLAPEDSVHAGFEQYPATRKKSTDDHSLGVEQIDEDGERLTETFAGLVHDFQCEDFTRFGGIGNELGRDGDFR